MFKPFYNLFVKNHNYYIAFIQHKYLILPDQKTKQTEAPIREETFCINLSEIIFRILLYTSSKFYGVGPKCSGETN